MGEKGVGGGGVALSSSPHPFVGGGGMGPFFSFLLPRLVLTPLLAPRGQEGGSLKVRGLENTLPYPLALLYPTSP